MYLCIYIYIYAYSARASSSVKKLHLLADREDDEIPSEWFHSTMPGDHLWTWRAPHCIHKDGRLEVGIGIWNGLHRTVHRGSLCQPWKGFWGLNPTYQETNWLRYTWHRGEPALKLGVKVVFPQQRRVGNYRFGWLRFWSYFLGTSM